MDILFVASELSPMAKVGGLADVVSALPKALRLLGHRVTIALPRHPSIEEAGIMVARRLTPMTLTSPSHPDDQFEVTVFDGRLGSGVDLLLLDVPEDASAPPAEGGAFRRAAIYGEDGEGYPDNARRYALFCRAAVEVVRQRAAGGSPFDVVHLHDWPTAMVAYLIKQHPELAATQTVLTLHNMAHQGVFDRGALRWLGLSDDHFHPDHLEFYERVNFLKGGILTADALTMVSPTYAREIQTKKHGEKLEGVVSSRADRLAGIVNGIDYSVFNPATDAMLAARFDAEDLSNKGRCKSSFCQEAGLEISLERPLIVSLGRVVTQKGSDILASALPRILRADVSVAIAGTGDPELMEGLQAAAAKSEGRAVYLGEISEPSAHRLIAAADIVLLPSRYEPCGLVQLYAQRYGALPVACRTGGLVDTIVDCDAELETGTGFLFDKPNMTSLVGGVQRAIAAIRHPRWEQLRRRVMRLDLGWDRAARRYANIYRRLAAAA